MSAAGGPAWTLVYDGECRLCLRTVNALRERDRDGQLELVPYQAEGVTNRWPDIPHDAFEHSVQLFGPGGGRWEGAAAIEKILALLPRTRWLAWLFRVPLIRPLAERVYRVVARHRHRFHCGDHCPIVRG